MNSVKMRMGLAAIGSRRRWALLGGIVAGVVGCHEHVALNAPPPSAPIEERVGAYKQLHPLSMHETHTTYLRGGAPVGASREVDYLQLADGRRVYYPEDLLPVVDENSASAQAATRSRSARSTSYTLKGVGYGGIVLGAGIMLVPLLQEREPGEQMSTTPILLGGAVMILGGVISLVSGVYSRQASDEASTAFETYDGALRARLDLRDRDDAEPKKKHHKKRAREREQPEPPDDSGTPEASSDGAESTE